MNPRINALREQRAKLIFQAQALTKNEFTPEEEDEFNKLWAEVERLDAKIDAIKKADEAATQLEDSVNQDRAMFDSLGRDAFAAHKDANERYIKAFDNVLRKGMMNASNEDRALLARGIPSIHNAQEIATPAKGGYLVPKGFAGYVTTALKYWDGVRAAGATVLPTSNGQVIPFPTCNDTSVKGVIVAEGTPASQQDLTFGNKNLNAYTFSSLEIVVSNELLRDSAVDLVEYIATRAGERVGRALGQYTTTGTGADQPEGIVTASTLGASAKLVDLYKYDTLVDLKYSVDRAYRQKASCGFMMNDEVLKGYAKAKDLDGRPLFVPSARDGEADKLLNSPVFVNNEMDGSPTTADKPVLFGDYSQYMIRDVNSQELKILDQPRGANNQTSFVLFSSHDGRFIDAGGGSVKHLVVEAP